MKGRILGYARVSSVGQNLVNYVEGLMLHQIWALPRRDCSFLTILMLYEIVLNIGC